MCVEDTPDVEAVLFGEQGVAKGLTQAATPPPPHPPIVIDHSTISPIATARFAERLTRETGALYLDAPVSGGDVGAKASTLSIMCGGAEEAFQRALPVLQAMGRMIIHIGPRPGDGQRTKLVNQIVGSLNCIGMTEGLRLGEAMGLDMEKVNSAVSQGAATSWAMVNMGPRWLKRDFKPGFRLRHLLKDLRLCREVIDSLPEGAVDRFPGARLALELVQRAVEAGYGDDNIHAMARVFLD
jgi:3-hydroxyisobutyrate dehydrogenase-like beta-hydroxyacid dehydrogenase